MAEARTQEPAAPDAGGGRVLNPIDRLTEVLYGIILVLTFTGTLRVATQGGEELGTTLWAAVGCSLAWGIVDSTMYVFGALASRNRSYQLLRALKDDPAAGRRALDASIPSVVAHALSGAEWDKVTAALLKLPVPPRARVTRDDVAGGAAIFLLANAALLPLAAPFVLIADPDLALHVSNGLALALLFATGVRLARYTGTNPLWEGLRFMAWGAALVALTIALGG